MSRFILLILLIVPSQLKAQFIDNVKAEIDGRKVNIHYNLSDVATSASIEVWAYLNESLTDSVQLQQLSGNYGIVRKEGYKTVIWNTDEIPTLNQDLRFKVIAYPHDFVTASYKDKSVEIVILSAKILNNALQVEMEVSHDAKENFLLKSISFFEKEGAIITYGKKSTNATAASSVSSKDAIQTEKIMFNFNELEYRPSLFPRTIIFFNLNGELRRVSLNDLLVE